MGWATQIVVDKYYECYDNIDPLTWEEFNEQSITVFDINKQYLLYKIVEICENEGCNLGVYCLLHKDGKDTGGWKYTRLNVKAINILLKKENVDKFMELYKEGFWSPSKTPKKYFNDFRKRYISALKCARHIIVNGTFGRAFIVEG